MRYRPARLADAAALAAIHAPYAAETAVTFQVEPSTESMFRHKIQEISPRYPFLVCEEEGRIAGFAYAAAFRTKEAYQWDVELTVYLARDCQGKDIGSGLYQRLLTLLRAQGFAAAYACVTVPNEASDALHRRFGFREVGRFPASGYKLGRWHDVVWYHLPLGELPDPPPAPLPFSALPAEKVSEALA